MTQADQEDHLLNKSPEYRKNEMIMLEELRRRKKMKDFYSLDRARRRETQEDNYGTPTYDRSNKVTDINDGMMEE
jgi:O-phosphoseryl-tRNA(Cys) synthetase